MVTNRLEKKTWRAAVLPAFIVVAIFLSGTISGFAQITGVFYEVDTAFYAPVAGSVDSDGALEGHVTYSIYAQFTNPTDVLGAIFSSNAGVPTEPLYIDVPCGCYNTPVVGDLLGNVLPGILLAFPAAAYDSYWTIGGMVAGEELTIGQIVDQPGVTTYNDANLCDAEIADGLIYQLFQSCSNQLAGCEVQCGGDAGCLADCQTDFDACQASLADQPYAAGDDLVIKIAQITSACGFSLHACFQVYVEGQQSALQTWCMAGDGVGPLTVSNVCEDFLTENAGVEVIDPLNCFGETAVVDVLTIGGTGPFTYNLLDAATEELLATAQQSGVADEATFGNLGDGDYIVEVVDANFCRDSTDLFTFIEPTPVVATWTLVDDNECPGVIDNAVAVSVEGGVGDYLHTALHTTSGGQGEFPQGDTLYVDIPCVGTNGDWEFSVEDGNGCSVDSIISLNCPADFVFSSTTTDVTCFGYDDGIYSGNFEGGTGELTIDIQIVGAQDSTLLTYAGGNFELPDLAPGDYVMEGTDENGCSVSDQFSILEPDPVSTAHVTTDVLCAGQCTGTIDFVAQGGVGGFTFQTTDMNGVTADANALCAGTYMAFSTDANGCIFEDQYLINEPDSILYEVVVSDVTCAGAANGSICVENATGGTGMLSYQVDPPATGYQTEPCFDLAVGTYSIQVQDENQCVVSVSDLTLIEPAEIEILPNVSHISCTSFADGSVDVSATGGTGDIFLVEPEAGELPYLISDLDAGEVQLQVEDANGCLASLDVSILEPDTLVVTVLATTDPVCGGDCNGVALLDVYGGSGGLTLTANNELDVNFNALCADEYVLEVVDANGCVDTASFEIEEPDPVAVVLNVADVTCTGMNDGAVSISPIGGTGPVVWSMVEQGVDLANMYEGDYQIMIQDSIGCTADTMFTIGAEEVTDMVLFMLSSPVTCWNEQDGTATVSVTGGYQPLSFVWSDPSGQTTPTATGLPEDVYSVVVTDSLGCTLTEIVEVEPTIGCLFIADAITPNGDGYNDEWIVGGLEYFPTAVVTVFNRYGQEMFRSVGYRQRWDGRFNNNQLPVADYYYVIDFVDGTDPITGTVTLKY